MIFHWDLRNITIEQKSVYAELVTCTSMKEVWALGYLYKSFMNKHTGRRYHLKAARARLQNYCDSHRVMDIGLKMDDEKNIDT